MLTYERSDHLEMIEYSYSDFVSYVDIGKSTLGHLYLLDEVVIIWKRLK